MKYIIPIIAILFASFGVGCVISVQIITYVEDHDVTHLYYLVCAVLVVILLSIVVGKLICMHLRIKEQFNREVN